MGDMMNSSRAEVYLTRSDNWADLDVVGNRLETLLRHPPVLAGLSPKDLVGIKLTFGEAGNQGHPPAVLIRRVVDAVRDRAARPFLTETNTLYRGRRMDALEHLEVAREHGFTHETLGAPILLSDGIRGREVFDVAVHGQHTQTAHLVPAVRDMGFLISVAHLTGHLVAGVGATIKNLGMGLASRAGKLDQHSVVNPSVLEAKCTLCLRCRDVCPVDAIAPAGEAARINGDLCIGCAECLAVCPEGALRIDWSRETSQVQETTAGGAGAVTEALGRRALYICFMNHITDHCDCMGRTDNVLCPDIGIAAATDPVALDQACADLAIEAAGEDLFRRAWPEVNWEVQLEHAEHVGLGRRAYQIVEL